jgi:hypothetical protein
MPVVATAAIPAIADLRERFSILSFLSMKLLTLPTLGVNMLSGRFQQQENECSTCRHGSEIPTYSTRIQSRFALVQVFVFLTNTISNSDAHSFCQIGGDGISRYRLAFLSPTSANRATAVTSWCHRVCTVHFFHDWTNDDKPLGSPLVTSLWLAVT